MACCRLKAHISGGRCRCCEPEPAPGRCLSMDCHCSIAPQIAALVPFPPCVLIAAPFPAHRMNSGRYDASAPLVEDSRFIPALFRPPNLLFI